MRALGSLNIHLCCTTADPFTPVKEWSIPGQHPEVSPGELSTGSNTGLHLCTACHYDHHRAPTQTYNNCWETHLWSREYFCSPLNDIAHSDHCWQYKVSPICALIGVSNEYELVGAIGINWCFHKVRLKEGMRHSWKWVCSTSCSTRSAAVTTVLHNNHPPFWSMKILSLELQVC